ncbi:methyltransferase domain-containing protein [Enterococcus raffinosus]|uniref:methyltransferase domain-containing protein n=1 Tax=Enterococcus raffinosus TaxID=71452 RepID=UPI001C0FBEA9|nr:methyltransferase domain-containing protein [Enterococcus raffinosus]MBU5360761.1 methyltransferase domain-containing protein [Enterococcus raffinosus]
MPDYLNELEAFWDDFAEEYEMIQQESIFPIAEELRDFLLAENLLPCQTFLDLAGGSGRYLSTIKAYVQKYDLVDLSAEMLKLAADKSDSNVQLIKNDQKKFLSQNKERYNIVFSAMNPALQTKEELLAFCQASHDWCLILRVVTDEDQIFSPYEEKNSDLLLNDRYKTFLNELNIPYRTKKFAYTNCEEITRDFFQEYFMDDFSSTELAEITEKTFGNKLKKWNQQFLDFELIYFHVPKTYNENGF